MTTSEILSNAKSAVASLQKATEEEKNAALFAMADELIKNTDKILSANAEDVIAARGKISDVMIDRLTLTPERIKSMAEGVRDVAALPDPVRKVIKRTDRGGLVIEKVSAPMGVVGIIYESRPNVTSDAAVLCVKSSNVCVLRAGKEAFRSANAIVAAMKNGLVAAGIDQNAINLIQDTTRQSAADMMAARGSIDLLIPRGGKGLIRSCLENAKVPCIETGTGICHIFVEKTADPEMALNIIENAKTSRPSVCNACECVLIDKAILQKFAPLLKERLVDKRKEKGLIPVELRTDPETFAVIGQTPAGEDDFDTEFLDYILAVKAVDGLDKAIEHIFLHSTSHSEAIITSDSDAAEKFCDTVDSAAVYVNASTRFTDGGEFGLGCEMGISTQKLHARGPMGLEELCTYKYRIRGNGNIR